MVNTFDGTLERAIFFARHLNGCECQIVITAVLLELGIPPKLIGFDYLERAIYMYYENPARILTKQIYPEVASTYEFHVSKYQVEKQIRFAIDSAWKIRNNSVWNCYFPYRSNCRPTNGDFIAGIARFVRLWEGCCKGNRESKGT